MQQLNGIEKKIVAVSLMLKENLTGLDCKVRACAEFESKISRSKRE